MNTATILAALLTAGPAQSPTLDAPPQFEVDQVSYDSGESGAEVIAYDGTGAVIGTAIATPDLGGAAIFAADFDDGYVEITRDVDGAIFVDSDLPPDVIEARLAAIGDRLELAAPQSGGPLEGKFTCVAGAVATVAACATLSIFCPVGIIASMCTCTEAWDVPEVSCP